MNLPLIIAWEGLKGILVCHLEPEANDYFKRYSLGDEDGDGMKCGSKWKRNWTRDRGRNGVKLKSENCIAELAWSCAMVCSNSNGLNGRNDEEWWRMIWMMKRFRMSRRYKLCVLFFFLIFSALEMNKEWERRVEWFKEEAIVNRERRDLDPKARRRNWTGRCKWYKMQDGCTLALDTAAGVFQVARSCWI